MTYFLFLSSSSSFFFLTFFYYILFVIVCLLWGVGCFLRVMCICGSWSPLIYYRMFYWDEKCLRHKEYSSYLNRVKNRVQFSGAEAVINKNCTREEKAMVLLVNTSAVTSESSYIDSRLQRFCWNPYTYYFCIWGEKNQGQLWKWLMPFFWKLYQMSLSLIKTICF